MAMLLARVFTFKFMAVKNMCKRETEIRKELFALTDDTFKVFATALIPGCDNLIGVRIPQIRKIAKKIAKDNPIDYLHNAEDIYFEETMLKALIIGNMNEDIEVTLEQITLFVPKITNWSLCDSFCNELKIVRNHKARVWKFLQRYYQSDRAYDIRFAVVMLLFYYVDKQHISNILLICDEITHEDYYVKMAVAWCLQVCFVNFPTETMQYLKNSNLDDFTYNKALQKINESLKVDKATKEIIKSMKRKQARQ